MSQQREDYKLVKFDRLDAGLGIISINQTDETVYCQEFDGDFVGPCRTVKIRYDYLTGLAFIEKQRGKSRHNQYFLYEFVRVPKAAQAVAAKAAEGVSHGM
jgi:hypothetical protein